LNQEGSAMHVSLLLPAPLATIGGGHDYDRAIIAALCAEGHTVEAVELAGRHPLADETAQAAAAAAWQGLPDDSVPVIDALTLPAFAPFADALAARHSVALVHHPVALEPHHDAATRAALTALERRLLALFARVIVTSSATAERLADAFGVTRARIAVVVPGTDAAPRSAGSGGSGCEILSLGVLTPRKGHDVLLRALALLPDLAWRLSIVGGARDRAYADTLPHLAAELGIAGRVRFTGNLVGDALEELWQRTDLFALATQHEGYGMAIAEALRRGIPLAVTEGGAASGLVTPQNGVVCTNGDHAALSRALRRLIFDTALRANMAEAAWQSGCTLPDWRAQARLFAAALAR
jgi:glycosyltransferase involved in cell wall biosynthesis